MKGNIWFGTNPVGVCRYDGKSFEWITEEDVTEFRNEGANGVRSIMATFGLEHTKMEHGNLTDKHL